MSQIHIMDRYSRRIKEVLSNKQNSKVVLEDLHTRNIENHSETFDFVIDYKASSNIQERDRVLIPDDELGGYREFIVDNIDIDTYDGEAEIKTTSSYLEDLQKAKPIEPQTIDQYAVKQAVDFALFNVAGWEAGDIDYGGFRTISWTSYNSPFDILKIIANRFDLQLDFTIETNGNRVTRRYVHMREKTALFSGKEVRRGKDLSDLQVQRDASEVVTALLCLAPEPEDGGNRLTTIIVDDEAQAQYGNAREYIWGIYEPESDDQNMTLNRLKTLGRTEINKRNKPKVDYTIEAAYLDEFLAHEQVLIGDMIRVKDDLEEPYFYVEATVKQIQRSVFTPYVKTYTLGEIIEFTREDITKRFEELRALFTQRMSETQSNFDNIVTIIDTQVERRIYKQITPPDNPINDQLWLDTTNPDKPILKRYFNGEWHIEIKAVTEASDIDAVTREEAMYEAVKSSLVNIEVSHLELLAEANQVKLNEYINDSHRTTLDKHIQTVINTYNLLTAEIEKYDESKKIDIQQSNTIHQMMLDYSAAINVLRAYITEITDFALAHLAYLQSQYTDEKYNDMMSEVAEKFGLVYEDGVLQGDPSLAKELEETRAELQKQLTDSTNTLNDMINNITGDSRNMIAGTSLVDRTQFSVQGGHTLLSDEPIDYIRIQKDSNYEDTNYIDNTTISEGIRIHLDGEIVNDSAHLTTDFIPVTPDSLVHWVTEGDYIEHPRIIFYGANQEYLEGILFEDDKYINFTIPSLARYIRLTAPVDKMNGSWKMSNGVYLPPTDSEEVYILFHNKADYVAGETYTLALDFRSTFANELDYISLSTNTTNHFIHDIMSPTPTGFETNGEWNRYFLQFTPEEDITQAQLIVGTDFEGNVVGDFDLRQIHLYKGANELSWQPAPEDNRQHITQLSREISDLEHKISTKMTRDDYDVLEGQIKSVNTEVTQTAEAITNKADKNVVDTINEKVTNHDATLVVHGEGIDTLINKTETTDKALTVVTNKSNETAEGLEQTITKVTEAESAIEGAGKAIEQAQADIKTNTEEISNKLSTAQYNIDQEGVVASLNAATSERVQLAKEISDKVTLTDYEGYKVETGTLGDANKSLNITTDKKGKWLRLAMNTGDRASGRFIIADRTSSQHGTAEFNASVFFNRAENAEFIVNSFAKMTSFPFTKARFLTKDTYDEQYLDVYFDPTRDSVNNISIWLKDNIQNTGWVLQNLPISNIPIGYKTTEYEINEKASTKGMLTQHATSITQNGREISLKASQSALDSVNRTLSEKQAELSIDAENIKGQVKGVSDRLSEVSTTVTQNKDSFDVSVRENTTKFTRIDEGMAEKVGKSEVVASINASLEGVKIRGDKVDISAGSSIRLAIEDAKTHADNKALNAENSAKQYADKEVAKVVVNGRNMFAQSTKTEGKRIHLDGTISSDSNHISSDFIPVIPNTDYIWHTHGEYIEHPRIIFYGNRKVYQEGKLFEDDWNIRFTTPSNTHFIRVTAPVDIMNEETWMVEKGTKASSHTEAPEDSQARISSTLSEIKDVSKSLSDFETVINTTFKDGIIQEAEAKAIRTYKTTLSTEKADLDQKYNTVYNNTRLAGTAKTNLASAKTAYNAMHIDLTSYIDTVIADNRVTTTEYNTVLQKFSTYENRLVTLTRRFEEANDYISTAKASTAESNAKRHADSAAQDAKKVSEAYAKQKAEAERRAAEAYADGIVTKEEKARIESDAANLRVLRQEQTSLENRAKAYSDGLVTAEEKARMAADDAKLKEAKAAAVLAETQAKAYADGKVTDEEKARIAEAKSNLAEAKKHADTKAQAAESAAKTHANSRADTAETNAKRHAETKANEAEKAAKDHADAKARAERIIAEAHADGIVSTEERARISDANAKLAEAKKHADNAAKAAEDAAKKVAEAAQKTADASTEKLDDMRKGGRNLLHDSGRRVITSSYQLADYYLTESIVEGTEVTVSFKAKLATGKSYFRLYNSGGNVSMAGNFTPTKDGEFEVFTHTFNWRVSTANNTFLRIYHMPNSVTATSEIEWMKLEYGKQSTGWSPAPEDIVEKKKIISEINLSDEDIKIQAEKVHIDGRVINIGQNPAVTGLSSTVNTVSGRVTTAQNAANAAQTQANNARVGNNIVNSINNATTTVNIAASKINLSGYTTFSDLSTPGKTNISGDNITTGLLQSSNGNTSFNLNTGTFSFNGNNGLIVKNTSSSRRLEMVNGEINSYADGNLTMKFGGYNLEFYNQADDPIGRIQPIYSEGSRTPGLGIIAQSEVIALAYPEQGLYRAVFRSDNVANETVVSGPFNSAIGGSSLRLYANRRIVSSDTNYDNEYTSYDQPTIMLTQGSSGNHITQYFGGVNNRNGSEWRVRWRSSTSSWTNRIVAHSGGVRLSGNVTDSSGNEFYANGTGSNSLNRASTLHAGGLRVNSGWTHLYLGTLSGGEVRITNGYGRNQDGLGNGGITYRDLRAARLYSDSVWSHNYDDYWVRTNSELRITSRGSTSNYRDIRFRRWTSVSSEEYKTDITEWNYNVLDVLKNDMKIYQYKYKKDENDEEDSKDTTKDLYQRGLIVERETPSEFILADGINQYEVTSWALKGVQELAYENDRLKEKMESLEERLRKIEENN